MVLESVGDHFAAFLSRQSKGAILAGALGFALFIGFLDYIIPYEISMSIFYVMPVLVAAWFADKKSGDLVAIVSVIVTWWTDELTVPAHLLGWNHTYKMFVRLFFFLFVSMGAGALKARRDLTAARIESDRKQIELLERSQRLEREIIRISEREQQRIGQDLHDGLCQYLAAITCAATSLKSDLQIRKLDSETATAAEIAELLKQAVTQTRNLARGLSPVHADEAGLESALHELAASATRLMGITCEFNPESHVPIRDNTTATHLYRIAQEALNNATRHGKATRITITLAEKNGTITLRITDNGKGLPTPAPKSGGMGQKVMDYRARLIGGTLDIANNADAGVTVSCTVPQKTETASLAISSPVKPDAVFSTEEEIQRHDTPIAGTA